MTDSSTSTDIAPPPAIVRAGFWRRVLSVVVDELLIIIPFALLTTILFAISDGRIQANGIFNACEFSTEGPSELVPAPTMRIDFWIKCTSTTFGPKSASWLTGKHIEKSGHMTVTTDTVWRFDSQGRPVDAITLDWLVTIAFLAYSLGLTVRLGQTIGDRVMKIRVIEIATPEKIGVSFKRVILQIGRAHV